MLALFLHLFSWLLVGSVFIMWAYGFEEAAYKYGKLAVAFLAGVQIGAGVG